MKTIKIFVLFFLFIYLSIFLKVHAMLIVHPLKQTMTVIENGIFFAGKIEKNETVFINERKIIPEKTGAFSESFPLKIGENVFIVKNDTETIKYVITRIPPQYNKNNNKFIEKEAQYFETIQDRTILRSSPVDAGKNRLGYLPKGTKVFVDGEYNEFSRIYLAANKYGWIMTSQLTKSNNDCSCDENFQTKYSPNKLIKTETIDNKTEVIYKFYLSDNVPYGTELIDNNLIVTIYNLNDSQEYYQQKFCLDKFPRYTVCMENGILCVSMKKNNIALKQAPCDIKIVIDAGHGGREPGAIGCLADKEKDLNLEVAKYLKELFEQNNYTVFMTREDDSFVSLNDRIKFAQEKDALLFISIHLNSVPISANPKFKSGSVGYYYNPQSEKLARNIVNSVSEKLQTKNGGAVQASLAVIRPTEYLSALIELAYLVNPKDVSVYKSENFSKNSAEAIYKGIINFIDYELNKN